MSSRILSIGLALLIAQGGLCGEAATDAAARTPGVEFFEAKVRPILVQHCYECHSTEARKVGGELLLDSRQGTRAGGESGQAVVPGDVDGSLLLSAIRHEDYEMPPDSKLPDSVIHAFERWIAMGAPDPREGSVAKPEAGAIDVESGREFWSFQPPRRHALPQVIDNAWSRRTIDRFILAKLEKKGLSPSPTADRRTLIRRVTFDLTGLPPTPEEVGRFLGDVADDAYERLVDRLLASPSYGERLARLWLDVSRYAEDQAHIVGNDKSLFFPNAHLYRDWVIDSFNRDMAYDDFIRRQLAVDLVSPQDTDAQAALGFLGLGPKYYRRNAPEVMADEWEDRVDTVSRGLLGLTVACARCHDHKYDPIPTEDYYALAGVFASTEMFNRPLDGQTKKDGQAKNADNSMHVVRDGKPTDLNVFVRGDVKNKGPLVKRRFLQALSKSPAPLDVGSGRAQLAEAIADENNPLTARVLVNRIWAMHFDRGLVATPSNFGTLGEAPSHPQLLDDLAVRFMQAGWSIKWLQRELVLSSVYRQSSRVDEAKYAADAENRWLGRMRRRRLDIESWRDAILFVTGRLENAIGGKSFDIQESGARRRTVYCGVSRFDLSPMLALFDFPDPNVHSAQRTETTTPLQKLFALNSSFMLQHAEALAQRLWAGVSAADRSEHDRRAVRRAYQLLVTREPTTAEMDLALDFLDTSTVDRDESRAQLAHVLLSSNEMLFLD